MSCKVVVDRQRPAGEDPHIVHQARDQFLVRVRLAIYDPVALLHDLGCIELDLKLVLLVDTLCVLCRPGLA